MAHGLLELLRGTGIHIRRNRAWVDSVDSSALRKLAGPGACHRFESSLGAAIDTLALEAERGADAADVDDTAAAVVGEVGDGGFHEEKRAAHIDVVEVREVVAITFFHCKVAGDACVVDDNVNLKFACLWVREVVFGQFDNVRGAVFGSHVGLHGEAFDAVRLLELLGELLGFVGGGVGGVVDYEVGAFGREVGAGGGADASGTACDYGEFAFQDARTAGCQVGGG